MARVDGPRKWLKLLTATAAVPAMLYGAFALGHFAWRGPGALAMAPSAGPALVSHADIACDRCHDGPPSPATPSIALGDSLTCMECHRGAKEASHPVDFVPRRLVPASFGLAAGERFTCTTCHAFHGETTAALSAGVEAGEAFCHACHEADFFQSMADGGSALSMSAHFNASGVLSADHDPYTPRCLICHDDKAFDRSQVAAAGFAEGGMAGAFGRSGAGAHPIGMSYEAATRGRDFQPRAFLSQEVLLPAGRVGCVSCHVPYAGAHARAPKTVGGLCGECHLK